MVMNDPAAIERMVLAEIATATYLATAGNLGIRLRLDYQQTDRALKALVLAGDVQASVLTGCATLYRLSTTRCRWDVERAS